MNKHTVPIYIFKLLMNTLFNERFRRSSLQFSPGSDLGLRQLLGLIWKRNTHNRLNPKQLNRKIKKGDDFVLLDIRSKKSFAAGHISNAVNIPLRRFFKIERFPFSRDTEIILICYLGIMSKEALSILADHGYKKLTNIDGGMGAWAYEQERTTKA
ncbi:MAG: rhodanese-like domain-containing protein [Bacteroidetes bacterium]|nr:rhodanese-like domain-containing protein [Bacteroidota bacterium]